MIVNVHFSLFLEYIDYFRKMRGSITRDVLNLGGTLYTVLSQSGILFLLYRYYN